MKCPRRPEDPNGVFKLPDEDSFKPDGTCTYCGSLDPDVLMTRLEAGDVELGPTDKDYKVYVKNDGGEPFMRTHRTDSRPYAGWGSPEHDWVTEPVEEAKFYFMHLSDAQMRRFVELLNAGKFKFGMPGRFYRMPYFVGPAAAGT